MKYFTLSELTRSAKAEAMGLKNVPSIEETMNIRNLVFRVLDPLREWYGHPIHVTSGFRSLAVNQAVGGSKSSQHMTGEAADIQGYNHSREENKKLFEYIRENMEFDQLINEYNYSWVHVSYKRDGNNRKQVLKIG